MAELQTRPKCRPMVAGIVLLLLITGMPAPPAAMAATDLTVGGTAFVSNTGGDPIRVRDGAGSNGVIVGRVYEGDEVKVVEGPATADDDSLWYKISKGTLTGFVHSEFLEAERSAPVEEDDEEEDEPATPAATNAATTTSLRLRSGAGTSFATLLTMPSGARITVTGAASNGFLPVTYGTTSGWASADYVRRDGDGGSGNTNPSETGPATTLSALNLRAGPATTNSILLVMPSGATVNRLGEESNGFLKVSYQNTTGWASATYLRAGSDGGDDDDDDTVVGTARTTAALNLRSSASANSTPILVMPSGAMVDLLEDSSNGFRHVRYNGRTGWAHSDYLTFSGDDDDDDDGGFGDQIGTAFTTTGLNLRRTASTTAQIISVMPAGAEVGILGDPQSGFYPVRYGSNDGWAFGDYLTFPGDGDGGGGGSGIIWPVRGGAWRIIQGYNGGTHQNRSSAAQYYYSLDIGRVEGGATTRNQSVYAPVSGTVVWNDPNSGGILIDMGNGYGVAMFHCTIASSWQRGDSVSQGDYLGFVSPPGGPGYQVVEHIHITLWRTPNGGSSPRFAAPFIGDFAISGQSFPDTGGSNMHGGKVFSP